MPLKTQNLKKKEKRNIGLTSMLYELEFKLIADFTFKNFHIVTISQKEYEKYFVRPDDTPKELFGVKIPKRKIRKSENGFILIQSTFDLEQYDSFSQGAAKIRPQLLVLHGILTFLTGEMFISFQNFSTDSHLTKAHISTKIENQILISNGNDLSEDLNKIVKILSSSDESKNSLIYTLFERWRKALFLELESEESYIYNDESVLAYIHILEVLSDEFKSSLDIELTEKREELINEILKISNSSENEKIKTKKISSLSNQLSQTQISLKSKIIQMLKDLNLYNYKTDDIVNRFIELRNSIAHGRKNLYQDKVVFPLKPFFSFIKDIDENTETLKILSATIISTYLNLNVWKAEWNCVLLYEPPPFSSVKEFIKNKSYSIISPKEFLEGKIEEVTPYIIAFYSLKKKLKLATLEEVLTNVILSSKIIKTNCQILFLGSVLLSDSKNTELAIKCRKIIQRIHDKKWNIYTNFRDILKECEYHEMQLEWFHTWLSSGKILS